MVCSRCGRAICYSCSKPYLGLSLCPNCYHTSVPKPGMAPTAPLPHVGAYANIPSGGVLIGPFSHGAFLTRFWWFPASLVAVAAGLIFLNGVALLSPAFFATWITILPWVETLGYFGFILGAMLGIVLIGTFVLMLLGFRVLAAFIIFPTAIVSLFIGGGFFAGVILGVLAGLLELLRIRYG